MDQTSVSKGRFPLPLVRLAEYLKDVRKTGSKRLSEDNLALALKSAGDVAKVPTGSQLTRVLNGIRPVNRNTIDALASYFPPLVNGDVNEYITAAHTEYALWHHSADQPLPPPESSELRTPVIRRDLFRSVTQQILNNKNIRLVTISASNPQQGRTAFALHLALYCAYDTPPSVRRSLYTVSLAQLYSDHREITSDSIARRVGAELGIARRTGRRALIQSIANLFEFEQEKPLLLIKDCKEIPTQVLSEFVQDLTKELSENSTLIILVSTQSSLTRNPTVFREGVPPEKSKNPNVFPEINVQLDTFSPEDTASYILVRTNCSVEERETLVTVCKQLKPDLRRPAVATLLAGIYNLQQLNQPQLWRQQKANAPIDNSWHGAESNTEPDARYSPPWEWFSLEDFSAPYSSENSALQSSLSTSSSSTSSSQEVKSLTEVIQNLLVENDITTAEDIFYLTNALLSREERALLYSLSIFNGRFTKKAAKAVFQLESDTESSSRDDSGSHSSELRLKQQRTEQWKFERALDKLCLLGAIIPEQGNSQTTHTFSVEAEFRDWIHNMKDVENGRRYSPYQKLSLAAKSHFFKYVGEQLDEALAYFEGDLQAIDPSSPESFTRLAPDVYHIDSLLTEIWSLIEEHSGRPIPIPEVSADLWNREGDGLEKLDRQKAWLGLACANLAILFDVLNMPWTCNYHLECAGRMLSESYLDSLQNQTFKRELTAVRAQINLSRLIVEVRHEGTIKSEICDKLSPIIKADLKACREAARHPGSDDPSEDSFDEGYFYGRTFHLLIRGAFANRRDCRRGKRPLDVCTRIARRKATEWLEEIEHNKKPSTQLWIAQKRAPLWRYLAFTAYYQRFRAEFRGGDFESSLQSGQLLLQASTFAREPRFTAQALIGLCQLHWCRFALSRYKSHDNSVPRWTFSDTELREIRDLLYQMGPQVANLVSDHATLRGHYLILFGLYNIEKALSEKAELDGRYSVHQTQLGEAKTRYRDRGRYGENLIHAGLALLNEAHWRGYYQTLLADVYLRHSLEYEETQLPDPVEGWPIPWPYDPKALAISYFLRSLQSMFGNKGNLEDKTPEDYRLSDVFLAFYQPFLDRIEESHLRQYNEIFIVMAANPSTNTANLVDITLNLVKDKKERAETIIRKNNYSYPSK